MTGDDRASELLPGGQSGDHLPQQASPAQSRRVSYLVGAPRITVDSTSNTPGPRTHILRFCAALESRGCAVDLLLASRFPLLGRFARIKTSDYADASKTKLLVADVVRIGVGLWTGAVTFARTLRTPAPDVIYERLAVFQSMSSFHRHKRRAVRVIEANGILSREAARDRNGLRLEGLAAAIEKHTLRKADLVVAISSALAREVSRFAGIDPSKILVIPNGADSRLLEMPLPDRSSGTVIAGFLGSLASWHKLPDLVRELGRQWPALEEATGGRGFEFRIIGDGSDREAIARTIISCGLEGKVRMLGLLPQDEALRECATWSIGVTTHQRSTSAEMYHSPLKLYEYSALGLAVVATPSDDATSLAADAVQIELYQEPEDFAPALVKAVLKSVGCGAETVDAAREGIRREHTWERRADSLLRRTRELAPERQEVSTS